MRLKINSKSEYRNPKQIRMFKWPKPETCFEHSNFGFDSDFGFRFSDFQ